MIPPSWTDCQNFPQLLFRLKPVFLQTILTPSSCENHVTTSIVNVTMPYVLNDVMKIKLATKWRHAGPCPVRAVIYQPINHRVTIAYIGAVY